MCARTSSQPKKTIIPSPQGGWGESLTTILLYGSHSRSGANTMKQNKITLPLSDKVKLMHIKYIITHICICIGQ